MNICLLNGMSSSNTIEDMVVKNLNKHKLNHLKLRDMNISPCTCCNGCSFTGKCVKNDDGIKIVEGYRDGDVIIFLTPIKYGAYS